MTSGLGRAGGRGGEVLNPAELAVVPHCYPIRERVEGAPHQVGERVLVRAICDEVGSRERSCTWSTTAGAGSTSRMTLWWGSGWSTARWSSSGAKN